MYPVDKVVVSSCMPKAGAHRDPHGCTRNGKIINIGYMAIMYVPCGDTQIDRRVSDKISDRGVVVKGRKKVMS